MEKTREFAVVILRQKPTVIPAPEPGLTALILSIPHHVRDDRRVVPKPHPEGLQSNRLEGWQNNNSKSPLDPSNPLASLALRMRTASEFVIPASEPGSILVPWIIPHQVRDDRVHVSPFHSFLRPSRRRKAAPQGEEQQSKPRQQNWFPNQVWDERGFFNEISN